jgi:hypothetical protein
MRPGRRRLALALLLPALLIGAAGCGDDDDDETTPSVTVPAATEAAPETTTAAPTTTETTPTTTKPKTGGTPSYDPAKPDAPENDVPPPPGSPQEQFEQLCEQNPAACG